MPGANPKDSEAPSLDSKATSAAPRVSTRSSRLATTQPPIWPTLPPTVSPGSFGGTLSPPRGSIGVPRILSHWHSNLAPATRAAYARDLERFAAFQGLDYAQAAGVLLASRGRAHELARAWRASMEAADLASRTIGRRLSALRSLVSAACELGAIDWHLRVRGPKTAPRRDVAGPPWTDVQALTGHLLAGLDDPAIARDAAIILLMAHSALRRAEIADLRVADLELARPCIRVIRKGFRDRVSWPISKAAARALAAWLGHRGGHPGPLWSSAPGRGRPSQGLSADALRRLVGRRAGELGLVGWRPHGLRHAAATRILELTGDVDLARRLLGHANLATTQTYLDRMGNPEARAVALLESEQDPRGDGDPE